MQTASSDKTRRPARAPAAELPPRPPVRPWGLGAASTDGEVDVDAVLDQRLVEMPEASASKPVVIRVATVQPQEEGEPAEEAEPDAAFLRDMARVAEQALPAWPSEPPEISMPGV